jgi:hypothetical protein
MQPATTSLVEFGLATAGASTLTLAKNMNPISDCALFCKRGDKVIPFVASVGLPRETAEYWECDWSMGDLFPHDIMPARSMSSMLALISALKSIVGFLKARCDMGDIFFFDRDLSKPIDDIVALFWSSYFPHPDDCRPKSEG